MTADPTGFVLALANIVIGTVLVVLSLRRWLFERWMWIKLAYAAVGVYWIGVYAFIAIGIAINHQVSTDFGKIFVRPGILVTLAAMAVGTRIGLRRFGYGH